MMDDTKIDERVAGLVALARGGSDELIAIVLRVAYLRGVIDGGLDFSARMALKQGKENVYG